MPYIHYLAWCGYQVIEDGAAEVLPDYGSSAFWQREVVELTDQIVRIQEAENPFGHLYG